MKERLQLEIDLLQEYFKVDVSGNWLLIKDYSLPSGMNWSYQSMNVCFEVPANYPSQAPYGIYVPSDLRIQGNTPASNYQEIAKKQPAFSGSWGLISWTIDGPWNPNQDIRKGANLLNFVRTFSERFKMGRV